VTLNNLGESKLIRQSGFTGKSVNYNYAFFAGSEKRSHRSKNSVSLGGCDKPEGECHIRLSSSIVRLLSGNLFIPNRKEAMDQFRFLVSRSSNARDR